MMKASIKAACPLFTVTSAILATVPSQALPFGISVQHAAIAALAGLAAYVFLTFSETTPAK